MCFVDLSPEASEEVQAHSGVLLRHVAVGSPLVPNLFGRIPEDQVACIGLLGLVGWGQGLARHGT